MQREDSIKTIVDVVTPCPDGDVGICEIYRALIVHVRNKSETPNEFSDRLVEELSKYACKDCLRRYSLKKPEEDSSEPQD